MEHPTAPNTSKINEQRPFMGLRSYEEKNKEQFGGRDTEIRELYTLVETNRLTIVFGKSGIGKTSLIKAGLIPKLQNNYFFPIYIRIDYFSGKTPLDQTRELIYQKLKSRDPGIPELGESTLWEYFRNLSLLDDLLTPLLIFDQFEEIFTIGKNKVHEVQEFITELSDLAENRVPVTVQEEWKKNAEIVSSFGGKPNFHMVISLREDFLANLESLKIYLPSMKNSRFRVMHLTALQAMDAVMKPAGKLIDHQVATQIIKKLPGITDLDFEVKATRDDNLKRFVIEPFLLSLICYEVNEKRIDKGLERITMELVQEFDISDVIELYYSKTMQGFGDNVSQGIEESLLTEGGFRKLQEVGELENEHHITSDNIAQLIEKRIIRKEMRDGVEYVELIHDVLLPVVKAKRETRIADLKEKEKAEAIQRAIKQDRNRRRRIIRTGLLMAASVISALLFVAYREGQKNVKTDNRAYASRLLLSAKILSNAYADHSTAALISRMAYKINKENGGEGEIEFYNSMYNSLQSLNIQGMDFEVAKIDSFYVKDIVYSSNGAIFFGATNGKVYLKKGVDSAQRVFYDVGRGNTIMSLSVSTDKKYLAVAGSFSDVLVFDLVNPSNKPIALATGDTSGTSRTVCFSNEGKLFLRLTGKIIGWDMNTGSRVLWNQKFQSVFDNGRLTNSQKNVPGQGLDYFEYNGGGNLTCMSTFNQKIAIGSESAIIILTKDTLYTYTSKNIKSPSAIEFDTEGNQLYIGNILGSICRLSLQDGKTELNQFQTARVTDIAFSNAGDYVASASFDKSVALWKVSDTWNSIEPLVLVPQGNNQNENTSCVSFSENNNYVVAGYVSGKVLKWPASSDILADLICANVQNTLDSSDLTILAQSFIKEKFIHHRCK